ncbi:MAG: glycerophosphoryl diester phosphodiesterase membrane domain-containing protein [Terracidiphilus sp.]
MQTNLRPMSLGEILDRTAQLYRTNFALLVGIAAVYSGILLVLNLGQIGVTALLGHLHMSGQLPWVTLAFVVVMIPLIFIFAGAAVAANNRAVAWINLGQPATIRGAYRSILPRLGRYLWLMTIVAFLIYLPFVIIFIGYFVFLFAYVRPKGLFAAGGAGANPQAAAILALVTLAFFLLSAAAMVYAIFMALRYSLAIPASVIEDLKARKAIKRSIELTMGSRGRIFILLLLIFVIELGLATITQVFFIVAAYTAAKRHGTLPVWMQIAQQVVGFLTNSFIGPMYATGLTLFYYDQRVRKEGFDIEWMMEAAGMNMPAPAAEIQPPSTLPEAGTAEPAAPAPAGLETPASPQPLPDNEPAEGSIIPESPPESPHE